jgi:hypothetical protein
MASFLALFCRVCKRPLTPAVAPRATASVDVVVAAAAAAAAGASKVPELYYAIWRVI